MTATFAEFLNPAQEHIAAAVAYPCDAHDDVRRGEIRQLSRLISTLAHYTGDVPLPDEFDTTGRRELTPQVQAALRSRLALRRASQAMRDAAVLIWRGDFDATHPAVRHLAAAADHLAAGRDLLQTHFAAGPSGRRAASSYWAPVITSEPVTSALFDELASLARTLAPWAARLAVSGPLDSGVPAAASQAIHVSGRWLWTAAATVEAAHRHLPPKARARRLLHAIPVNTPPPHRPPASGEHVAGLCDGIAVTAERLRCAAVAFTRQARWSPSSTSLSWRRDALAAAITTHASEIVLRTLAERARQLGLDPGICLRLHTAAGSMSQAWPAWRAAAHHWDTVSTGHAPGTSPTPVAAEIEDLALRAGRLAYDTPDWTPAARKAAHPRGPADLAPEPAGIVPVTAAIHTFTAYRQAIEATTSATATLDDAAAAIGSPTILLTEIRRTSTPRTPKRPPEQPPQQVTHEQARAGAGQLERMLHDKAINDPALLTRAGALDAAVSDLLAQTAAIKEDARNSPPSRPPTSTVPEQPEPGGDP